MKFRSYSPINTFLFNLGSTELDEISTEESVIISPSEISTEEGSVIISPSEISTEEESVIIRPSEISTEEESVIIRPSEISKKDSNVIINGNESSTEVPSDDGESPTNNTTGHPDKS